MRKEDSEAWRRRREPAPAGEPIRTRRSDSAGRRREDRHRHNAGRLVGFVALFLFALGAFLWSRSSSTPWQTVAREGSMPANLLERLMPACTDPFPAAGPTAASPEWNAGATPSSTTQFINETPVDRIVDLMTGERVVLTVAIPAGQTSSVKLPVGAYDWRLRHGAAWCASAGRFVREQRTIISDGLHIVATSTLLVHIEPDAKHPSGFSLRTSDRPVLAVFQGATPSAQPLPGGGILLPRASDGHYYLDGMVEDRPVRFLIDTGATGIAIPADLARQLGYTHGREVVSSTANGKVIGYAVRARRLTFGPFLTEDIEVAALPALDRPLLGMRVLQALEIRQTADGLELKPGR